MTEDLLYFLAAGFLAQLVDGALGMAYGVTASSLLMSVGVPPVAASATVHAAECFTTGASALSHRAFGNISKTLFRRLLLPGVVGAIIGSYVLTAIPGDIIKPWVGGYLLLLGLYIIAKAFRQFEPKEVRTHLTPLAFIGAMLDAMGGGGWGAIVTSNLLARGNDVRETIGSVNAVEFFVTLASSAVFISTLGLGHWKIIAALALGGLLAAPLGAWFCGRVPRRPFMILVGVLITALSARTVWLALV
ncbi:MAG TPA: sulfite exporter TauE/SafE family protein [Lacunisphaera sp.]|nr:sulfite exporter TauE/SafE family protein [Lacunisphaera sp.]